MRKLWHDIQYEPVIVFSLAASGLAALAASFDSQSLMAAAAVFTAFGGVYTRQKTQSKKYAREHPDVE